MNNHYIIAAIARDKTPHFRDLKQEFELHEDESEIGENNIFLRNLPHITLKYPFNFKGSEAELVRQLETISFHPFTVKVEEIDVFNTKKYGNIIVALPEKHSELMKLHDDIYESISGLFEDTEGLYFERDKFNPHKSVLYKVPNEKLEEAKRVVKNKLIPYTFTLDQFGLYKSLPGNLAEREIVKEFYAKI
jgi:2'-5' RNA ligase